MLNKVFIMGRMTRDPELRHTQSGTAVASFSLAVERDFKDKATGEKVTDFIDCVAWRGTAESVSRYFAKGSMAVVIGALQIRSWDDKGGNKRRTAEVVAESVYFAGQKPSAQNPQGQDASKDPLDQFEKDAAPILDSDYSDNSELPF